MTPYVYQQFYLALINDGELHAIIHRADFRRLSNNTETAYYRGDQSVRCRVRKLCKQFNMREPTERQLRELVEVVIRDHLSGQQSAVVNEMERDEAPPNTRRYTDEELSCRLPPLRGKRHDQILFDEVAEHEQTAKLYLDRVQQQLDECNPFLYDPATGKIERINPTSKEPTIMSDKVNIETRIFLNGVEAKQYTDAQLIEKIEQAEAEVTRLEGVKTKSQKITDRIKELTAGAAQLAELLDARK